jgi:hypothetical protein
VAGNELLESSHVALLRGFDQLGFFSRGMIFTIHGF